MNSKVEKRRNDISKLVQSEGLATVARLSELYGVTSETIRSDLDYLAEYNGWHRTHGGIQKEVNPQFTKQYFFHEKQNINREEKKQLCYGAIQMISDGDCIYVDSGSTVLFLLNYLNQKNNLTIVTHSIAFMVRYILEGYEPMFKEQGHRFIFVGGEVNGTQMFTHGIFVDRMIHDFVFDHIFFSVDALDFELGGTNVDYHAYVNLKTALNYAKNKIILVDASKFNMSSTYKVVEFHEVDVIVATKSIPKDWIEYIEKKQIECHLV